MAPTRHVFLVILTIKDILTHNIVPLNNNYAQSLQLLLIRADDIRHLLGQFIQTLSLGLDLLYQIIPF